jgi:SOS-response transcriptional repressor LexA
MGNSLAFWLVVKDDSMTSPAGPCVPEESMILVDTGRSPESGHLVVAKLDSAKEATFKQFIVDEGTNRKYLKPLNTNYKPVEIDDSCGFIGVVVECRMSFVKPDPAQSLAVIPQP